MSTPLELLLPIESIGLLSEEPDVTVGAYTLRSFNAMSLRVLQRTENRVFLNQMAAPAERRPFDKTDPAMLFSLYAWIYIHAAPADEVLCNFHAGNAAWTAAVAEFAKEIPMEELIAAGNRALAAGFTS